MEIKKISKIEKAIGEAEKFIETAHKWIDRITTDKHAYFGSKEGGACKRSSLDLTRALSEMRKP